MKTKRIYKKWTKEETKILIEKYKEGANPSEIAKNLNCSSHRISQKIYVLKISRSRVYFFTEEEKSIIIETYTKANNENSRLNLNNLSKKINRSPGNISRFAGKQGLTNFNRTKGSTIKRKYIGESPLKKEMVR